jgi:hypothetical protein
MSVQIFDSPKRRTAGRCVASRSHHVGVVVVGLVAAAAMAMIPAFPAWANSAYPTPLRLVSGTTPLVRHDPTLPDDKQASGWCGTRIKRQDWEQDNALSVNPTDHANLVAAWIQDFDDAIVVGYSIDGGATWEKPTPPPTTPCTGGLTLGTSGAPGEVSALDPSISFGPPAGPSSRGVVYLTSVLSTSGVLDGGPGVSAIVFNRSLDGGRTWSEPAVLDSADPPLYVDTSYVRADPSQPGTAYAVWNKGNLTGASRFQYVSRTTDGGLSWSSPSAIPSALPEGGGQLLVLGDGTLVDIAAEVAPQYALALHSIAKSAGVTTPLKAVGPTTFVVRRSLDHGSTWLGPIPIAVTDASSVALPSAALAPDGRTIYSAWQQRESGSDFSVMLAKSADGGLTWQSPTRVGDIVPGPPLANVNDILVDPSLAIAPDGTVGVAFYDHRSENPPSGVPHNTDYWLRHLHVGGSRWEEAHLAGPFDQWSVPSDDGTIPVGTAPGFVGDYQGIAPVSGGFATTFALGKPFAGKNDDIFFSLVRLGIPDMLVSTLATSNNKNVREGDKVTITATVKNAGGADAAVSKTRFVLDGSTVLGTVDTPAVPAGGSVQVSVSWDTRGVKGSHTIVAMADSAGTVDESNEANNTGSLTVTVQGNKVKNGSFEQANATGSGPDAWTASSTGAGTATWSAGGTDGSRSVSVTGNGGSALLSGSPTWTGDPIEVTSGENLSLRVSVCSAGVSSAPTANLAYLNVLGQVIGTATVITAPLNTGGFTTLESAVVIPPGVVQVRVLLSGFSPLDQSTAGTVTFDDVGLYSG